MKLETLLSPNGEMEGANIMVTNKDLAIRMSCAMTWEEIAALQVALAAANS